MMEVLILIIFCEYMEIKQFNNKFSNNWHTETRNNDGEEVKSKFLLSHVIFNEYFPLFNDVEFH